LLSWWVGSLLHLRCCHGGFVDWFKAIHCDAWTVYIHTEIARCQCQ
ncbi:hypothetical protein BAE44_0013237, partial [Dichanthelium oligosanthes]